VRFHEQENNLLVAPMPLMMRFCTALLLGSLVFGATACSDKTPAGPNGAPLPGNSVPPGTAIPAGIVVSNPRAASTTASISVSGALAVAAEAIAYLSAEPATFPNAVAGSVRNISRSGASVSIAIVNGGFDPVRVPAEVGDQLLLLLVTPAGGSMAPIAIKVPARHPPAVVRTNPPKGRTDVALNVQIEVVFSEPVEKSTITTSSIAITRLGIRLTGKVSVSTDGLSAQFTPDMPLEYGSTYSLVISQDVRDLDQEALVDAFSATFDTAPSDTAGSLGQLAFAQYSDGGIYSIDANGTGLKKLAVGRNPAWSPDGRRIAFAQSRSAPGDNDYGMGDIYVMDADGSHIVQRTANVDLWSAAWSPDGRKLAVSDEGVYYSQIYIISPDADGSIPTVLATDARSPAWSPDGQKIAYVHTSGDDGYHQVYLMNADGTDARAITESDGGGIFSVAWSPDGRRIAFSKCLQGVCDVYVMSSDGSQLTQITSVGTAREAAWSPDGKWIAVSLLTYLRSSSGLVPDFRLTYMPVEGGAPRQIVVGGFHPSWRPLAAH